MSQSRLSILLVLLAAAILCSGSAASAALIASDSAADTVYNDGWQTGDDGGSGWGGGWSFRNQTNVVLSANNSSRGWFVGNSLNNNSPAGSDSNGDGDINTPGTATGRAWGVYSNATDQVYAIRPLNGALDVQQIISWDMDNGNIATDQVVGLRLISNANDVNSRVFEFRFVGGNTGYSVFDSTGHRLTTLPFSREGLHVEYTLTGPSTYSITITRKSNGATETITGTNVNANSIVALAFKNQFAGSGSAADAFVNSISVTNVPEPAMAAVVVLAGLGLLGRRRGDLHLQR